MFKHEKMLFHPVETVKLRHFDIGRRQALKAIGFYGRKLNVIGAVFVRSLLKISLF